MVLESAKLPLGGRTIWRYSNTMSFPLYTGICRRPSENADGEMMKGIGSRCRRPPYVTGNHGKEGTDARGDRNTHPAVGRLRGVRPGGGRDHEPADAVGAADGRR